MAALPRLVLASASPRRRALLAELGLDFEVAVPEVDETPAPGEAAGAYARRVASEKAGAIAGREAHRDAVVLAADTSVVLGQEILGKPATPDEAQRMLRALAGREHRVVTGLALAHGGELQAQVVITRVRFRGLSEAEIAWYVATGEPMDKAGAYAIQERGGCFVAAIDGSHSNVIGLPLAETLALLHEAGVPLPWAPGSEDAP